MRKVIAQKTKDGVTRRIPTYQLVPIDHGLCIPDNLNVCSFDLCWLGWRQAGKPFSLKSLSYIRKIDPVRDIQAIEKIFHFRPVCLRNIRISTTLLKRAAEQGLTLEQIGQILCRPDEDDTLPSFLEKIVQKARQITDMIFKMQKYSDSKLRSINDSSRLRAAHSSNFGQMEEFKLGETRQRSGSNFQNGPTRAMDLSNLMAGK